MLKHILPVSLQLLQSLPPQLMVLRMST